MEYEVEHNPEELRRLLEFIHRSRGFDFSGYKRTSLQRRLSKRMHEVDIETPAEGVDLTADNAAAYGRHLRDMVGPNIPLIATVPRPTLARHRWRPGCRPGRPPGSPLR